MSDLVKQTSFLLATREDRATNKELARIRRNTGVSVVRRNAEIDAIESVTESALLATAHVSALEGHLMQRVPDHARARLAHVADGGAMAMANVVAKLAKS